MLGHKRGEGPTSSKTGPFTLRQTRLWQVISHFRDRSTSGRTLCRVLTRRALLAVQVVDMPVAVLRVSLASGAMD